LNVSEYIIEYLKNVGIEIIFLLPGGGSMYLVEAARKSGMKIVPLLHEQSLAVVSDAYNQYKNELKSVIIVTTGPGGTNLLTGVAASFIDSIPLLVISGQVKTTDLKRNHSIKRQFGVQEFDIISSVKHCTKYANTITSEEILPLILSKALFCAKNKRQGPSWIEVPLDIQNKELDDINYNASYSEVDPEATILSYHDSVIKIDKIIELINNSKKPIILAGNGIRLSDNMTIHSFRYIIEQLGIPILLTWKMIDSLDENNYLNFGRPGVIGQRYANIINQECDLLISIGARLDNCQVAYDYNSFAKNAKKVVIDIDEDELYKIKDIDVRLNMDAGEFLNTLRSKVDDIKKVSFTWLNRCRDLKEKYPICLSEYYNNNDKVNPYIFVEELSNSLNKNDIIIPSSSGSASEIVQQAFKIKEGQRLICSPGLGSMGFALPHAIGVSFASNKKKRIICIEGDGSIQYNITDLQTVKQEELPIKIFIFSNKGYASIRNTQNKFFKGNLLACDETSGLTLPDIMKIGKAYGIKTEKIENHKQLYKKLNKVLNFNGPIICKVVIDETFQTQPKVQAKIVDGKMQSGKLEDMWPYMN